MFPGQVKAARKDLNQELIHGMDIGSKYSHRTVTKNQRDFVKQKTGENIPPVFFAYYMLLSDFHITKREQRCG
jgi:hypothetical protein